MTSVPFILASSSASRRMMLEAAGLPFSVVAPGVDEDLMKEALGEDAEAGLVAEALAEAKAVAVSERHLDAVVLGADQVLRCDERLFNKAMNASEAAATLRALKNTEHELISAAVIARGGVPVWRRTESARLRMRDFSEQFLTEYLTAELPDILGSVGCYRIEGRGAQLFTNVKGDQFCIRGLPLIAVLEALRQFGVLTS